MNPKLAALLLELPIKEWPDSCVREAMNIVATARGKSELRMLLKAGNKKAAKKYIVDEMIRRPTLSIKDL